MMLVPLLLALTPAPAAQELDFYIGTYTSKDGSKGIYHAKLNPETGEISAPTLAAEANGPSFVTLHPNGRFLYAAHEPTNGEVSAYAIGADRKLTKLNTEAFKGTNPCHVSVDSQGKNLLVAAYSGGSVACFPIRADGSLAAATTVIENSGSGPNKSRQERPHLHAIYADAKSRFVYACDLGTDEVLVYRFDPTKGTLTPSEPKAGKVPPGGGPRHLAFHPGGGFAYVNNEMLNSVTTFSVDGTTGALKELQTLSTLPEGESLQGKSTAEIACHPNGRWLYVSNRGHNSIAAYGIGADGKLTLMEIQPVGVREPRGFGLDPTGRWIVVGGQSSNDLTSLAIDPATGKLEPSGKKVAVGTPVCVAFK